MKRAGWRLEKKNRIMHFFIKNSFYSSTSRFPSSEPLERWATMWPHSEHLVTIWNTPAVEWRRWRRQRRSLVLFMILDRVAIWFPPLCWLPGMAPIYRGVGVWVQQLSPSHCISLLLTQSFKRKEVARLPLSWLWGTFYIASGVCQCD